MSNLPPSNGASEPQSVPSISEGDWRFKMVLERSAAQSTVIIVETSDVKRILEIQNRVNSLFKCDRVIEYNIQTNQIFENGVPIYPDVPPLQYLINTLTSSSTPIVVIIYYIFNQQHADFLSDFLVYVAQNEKLYANNSTVIAITSNLSLFSQIVQKFSIIVPNIIPTEKEIRELITHLISIFSQKIPIDVNSINIDEIVQYAKGLTLHEIESIILKSIRLKGTIDARFFSEYKVELLRKYGLTYIEPTHGFESIGGYEYIKEYIRNYVIKVLKNPEKARKMGITITKGILFFGPPGVGKTLFAMSLAKELGLPMVILNPSDFLRGIVGETEQRVQMIITLLESLGPVVVFIDEVDQIAIAREKVAITDSGASRRMFNMLLAWLGMLSRKTIIIAATNYVSDLDPAFVRPGRIDEIIVILPPDFEARKEILRVHTSVIRKIPLGNDVNIDELARRTFLWSGAELEKLVLTATRIAFARDSEKVEMRDFEEAFNSIEINISERERAIQRVINDAKRLENINKKFLNEALKVFASDANMNERVKSLLAQLK
jgi:AAA+ superfamily predicted ATPase